LVKTFANCFRLLAKLNAGLRDGFFVGLVSEKSEELLSGYMNFLKMEGEAKQTIYVAQCRGALISQIKNTRLLLEIIKHLNLFEPATPLLLERELLKLELELLKLPRQIKPAVSKNKKGDKVSPVLSRHELSVSKTEISVAIAEIPESSREILDFIKSQQDQVRNSDVFAKFSHLARRTLKRKLSELVSIRAVRRIPKGKQVFYAAIQTN